VGRRIVWIPLWGDESLEPWPDGQTPPLRAQRGWGPEETVLLYSGNMGLGHRFDDFLAAAVRLANVPELRWVFAGNGRRAGEIDCWIRDHHGHRVERMGPVPSGSLREHLASGDVHLVSLEPAWEGSILPSKLQAAFAAGRPVIFAGPGACSMARWVRESGGGWTVEPGDVDGLQAAVREAMDPSIRRSRGMAARRYAVREFDRERNVARICDMFQEACRCTLKSI
jgi:glycosyltransferase involved in cell wall biosynthesis